MRTSAEWHWRDDVQMSSKPWQAVLYYDGKVVQKSNHKKEAEARRVAEKWSSNAKRTGRIA